MKFEDTEELVADQSEDTEEPSEPSVADQLNTIKEDIINSVNEALAKHKEENSKELKEKMDALTKKVNRKPSTPSIVDTVNESAKPVEEEILYGFKPSEAMDIITRGIRIRQIGK